MGLTEIRRKNINIYSRPTSNHEAFLREIESELSKIERERRELGKSIKSWEAQFRIENNRNPSTDEKIRNLEYSRYRVLKSRRNFLQDLQHRVCQQLEQEIRGYQEILNDLDGDAKVEVIENANQECAICCEIFNEDRKKVAYGPCGHSMACVECSETMLRKTTANIVRGRKNAECPICRTEIKSTIILQGIY